jgi:hypothetical protein
MTGKVDTRRGAGVVDRDGLENRLCRKAYEGSNPSLSANDRRLIQNPLIFWGIRCSYRDHSFICAEFVLESIPLLRRSSPPVKEMGEPLRA